MDTYDIATAKRFLEQLDSLTTASKYVSNPSLREELRTLYLKLINAEQPIPRLKAKASLADQLQKQVSDCSACLNKLTTEEMKAIVSKVLSSMKAHRAVLLDYTGQPPFDIHAVKPNF